MSAPSGTGATIPADLSASLLALVPAAGSGDRFGSDRPKVLTELAGRPLLCWTLESLLRSGVERVVVALPERWVEECRSKVEGALSMTPRETVWIEGGRDRQESVKLCLAASGARDRDLVLVHDGARPAVSPIDVAAVVSAAKESGAALLGRPVTDTLKRVDHGLVVSTVNRESLFRAETPQAFRCELLKSALAHASQRVTDESALFEGSGEKVRAVAARFPNPKLTHPADLALLEALLETKQGTPADG